MVALPLPESSEPADPDNFAAAVAPQSFVAIVLAGGKSRRMGVDKATLVHAGQTLLERAIEQSILAGAAKVIVVGGEAAWLGTYFNEPLVRWTADRWPGDGPLGGFITGFLVDEIGIASGPRIVLSCDLPFVNAESIAWLVRAWFTGFDPSQQAEACAFVANIDGNDQPLCGAYSAECANKANALFQSGQRSLVSLLSTLVLKRGSPGLLTYGFEDVDTPDEWERAQLR